MAEHGNDESLEELGACPSWCVRRHSPGDHPEDRLHQSPPRYAVLVSGRPPAHEDSHTLSSLVGRLVQRPGSPLVWLEVAGEEDRDIGLAVTTESARRLVTLLETLLAMSSG